MSVADGRDRLAWARAHMPVHAQLREDGGRTRPLDGLTVAVCSHLEAKTGVFIETLAAAGARVLFTASEPMSTQDDVVAALEEQPGLHGFARHGVSDAELSALHSALLDFATPDLILDDAAELTARLVERGPGATTALRGTCEQTTTGVQRLRAIKAAGQLTFPVYAVNDTPMKRLFDNVHGTGESVLANLLLVTNLLLAGRRVVVAGFGHCGRGIARRARDWGARVTVTEVDPRRALQAHMDGFEVADMRSAAALGECFITATGGRDVIREEHFGLMRDGAVLANAGHFNVEIARDALAAMAVGARRARAGIDEYRLSDGRRINLVAEGRLVNLAAPTSMGHPVEVMDQTFAMQYVAALDLLERGRELGNDVHPVPDEVDRRVAALKLQTLGVATDTPTDAQRAYSLAWRFGDIKPE